MIAESIRMHPHGADHFAELFARFGIADARRLRTAADWYRNNRFHGLHLFSGVEAGVLDGATPCQLPIPGQFARSGS